MVLEWLRQLLNAWFTRTLLFPAPATPSYTSSECQHLSDGTAYFFRDVRRANDNQGIVILYSHGNRCDAGQMTPLLATLAMQFNVSYLSYDYPGYGLSRRQTPSEHECVSSLMSAYDFLIKECFFAPRQVLLFGRSIGCVPTLRVAAHLASVGHRVGGVFLQSPFSSLCALAGGRGVRTWLLKIDDESYNNVAAMHALNDASPALESNAIHVTIVHGRRDTLVPYSHARELADQRTGTRVYLIDLAGHNDLEFYSAWRDCVQEALSSMLH